MTPTLTLGRSVKNEAAAWFERLSQKSISTAEIRGFFEWRRALANDAAYRAVETAWERTRGRFVTRPDPLGFSVIDRRSGDPATFANVQVAGVPEHDALDIAALLNRRAIRGDDSFGAH
jgi:ferric-dicitrate binding protein FerR (iron transport regulator)